MRSFIGATLFAPIVLLAELSYYTMDLVRLTLLVSAVITVPAERHGSRTISAAWGVADSINECTKRLSRLYCVEHSAKCYWSNSRFAARRTTLRCIWHRLTKPDFNGRISNW